MKTKPGKSFMIEVDAIKGVNGVTWRTKRYLSYLYKRRTNLRDLWKHSPFFGCDFKGY